MAKKQKPKKTRKQRNKPKGKNKNKVSNQGKNEEEDASSTNSDESKNEEEEVFDEGKNEEEDVCDEAKNIEEKDNVEMKTILDLYDESTGVGLTTVGNEETNTELPESGESTKVGLTMEDASSSKRMEDTKINTHHLEEYFGGSQDTVDNPGNPQIVTADTTIDPVIAATGTVDPFIDLTVAETTVTEIEIVGYAAIEISPGEECLCHGSITFGGKTIYSSFIQCTAVQLDKFEELRVLGSASAQFLSPVQVVSSPARAYFVVEPLETLQAFFDNKFQRFWSDNALWMPTEGSEGITVQLWWDTIKHDIYLIFRQVNKGLMFLYKKRRYSCGNLSTSIFVSRKSRSKSYDDDDDDAFEIRVKLLPSMTKSKDFIKEIEQLKEIMESIIFHPPSIPNIDAPCMFEVNNYLKLLSSFSSSLGNTHFIWLLDHPFLWSSIERVFFLRELVRLYKAEWVISKRLGGYLDQQYFKCNKLWTPLVQDPLLKAILDKPSKSSKVTPYVPGKAVDIFRFISACFSHANEDEYEALRGKNKILEDEEIEKRLSSTFPFIYTGVKDGLSLHASHYRDTDKLLKNWSIGLVLSI